MTGHLPERARWTMVVAFAAAMAYWPLSSVALLLLAAPALHLVAFGQAKKRIFRW